jgi:hypothetical protein
MAEERLAGGEVFLKGPWGRLGSRTDSRGNSRDHGVVLLLRLEEFAAESQIRSGILGRFELHRFRRAMTFLYAAGSSMVTAAPWGSRFCA